MGLFHNKSIESLLEISEASLSRDGLHFNVFRTEGVDTYGSLLLLVRLTAAQGNTLWKMEAHELSSLFPSAIENKYLARIKPGAFSLEVPLGAKAGVTLPVAFSMVPEGPGSRVLTDVSGKA